MEKFGIGTKATRAEILQTLYKRGYVKDERITVTELGLSVIKVLSNYAPALNSAQLTQEIEGKIERIQNGEVKRETVLEEVVEQLKPQLEQFKEHEAHISEVLSKVIRKSQTQASTLGKCPTCNTGDLVIIHSRRTKKRFIGCSNYFKDLCETSFPLPQHGTVKPIKRHCNCCGSAQVLIWLKAKKPWNMCLNPDCSHKSRGKKKL
jgi:DNA topoisomerase-1